MSINLIKILQSGNFLNSFAQALQLTKELNKEAFFSCWMSNNVIFTNLPAVGEKGGISFGHNSYDCAKNTGYFEMNESRLIIDFHTHQSKKRFSIYPSPQDLITLSREAYYSYIASLDASNETWINPIGVIATPYDPRIMIYQIKPRRKADRNFKTERRFAQIYNKLYRKYFPWSKRKIIYDYKLTLFFNNIPPYIFYSEKRLKEFLSIYGAKYYIAPNFESLSLLPSTFFQIGSPSFPKKEKDEETDLFKEFEEEDNFE